MVEVTLKDGKVLKVEKGKTISEIADDLEDTEENIVHLIKEFHLGRKES